MKTNNETAPTVQPSAELEQLAKDCATWLAGIATTKIESVDGTGFTFQFKGFCSAAEKNVLTALTTATATRDNAIEQARIGLHHFGVYPDSIADGIATLGGRITKLREENERLREKLDTIESCARAVRNSSDAVSAIQFIKGTANYEND